LQKGKNVIFFKSQIDLDLREETNFIQKKNMKSFEKKFESCNIKVVTEGVFK
jgi:hypothetical protein